MQLKNEGNNTVVERDKAIKLWNEISNAVLELGKQCSCKTR